MLFFFLNLVALGGGPPFAGWLIDHFAAFHHAYPLEKGLWAAMRDLFATDSHGFQAACPGGLGKAGESAAANEACKTAVQLATRQGVIVVYGSGCGAPFTAFSPRSG